MRFSLVFHIVKHFFFLSVYLNGLLVFMLEFFYFLNSIFIILFSIFYSGLAAIRIPLTFSISLYIPLCLCYND